ncbi:hypothetical protein PCK1_000883 [Pneumocystis canis]|nr:hypothetical protein PCK1_000883 [Pneumocystis canis]
MGIFWAERPLSILSVDSFVNELSDETISETKLNKTCPYDMNPLNQMPKHLPQTKAYGQKTWLPTKRTLSSIPRYDTNENWEYPSPQQMYHAMIRKGHRDIPEEAVEPIQMIEIVRYVIDYYDAPSEPSGEPVFYLDIRPAIDTPSAAYSRIRAWTSKTWAQLSKKMEELHS